MRRHSLKSSRLLLPLCASPTFAAFTQYAFASNSGNSSTFRRCPSIPYPCEPPSVCAYDDITNKYYCCKPSSEAHVCWAPSQNCAAGTNTPSNSQQLCIWPGGNDKQYCCGKQTEECTQDSKRFNICWSTLEDEIATLNGTQVNATFSVLSSANPSVSLYSINSASLFAMTTTTPGSATTPTASLTAGLTIATRPNPTSSLQSATLLPSPTGSPGLSAGAKGGIAGGVVGGVALLGIAGLLLWRRRKNKMPAMQQAAYATYGYQPPHDMPERYAQKDDGYAQQPNVVEAPNGEYFAEMPGSQVQARDPK
ncbi:hypothetical protein B0J11DRAFT_605392 [Dendryphion nanum]|uniref:Uncharacterized protein n=1 Tax=Dendryphion nanum TaxID=256645 RepID=A0A9P9DTT5_9PLEO|nr:hypothetical protein B0J11DRAFT_605392 [Dendryphion nanum]